MGKEGALIVAHNNVHIANLPLSRVPDFCGLALVYTSFAHNH